ncbi:hypothetical protein QBC46DRAFT_388157 [Diplogelasinospora grovesii]|uniref:Uncharacterized protein n=1 Tax=Diplogelasinospora grovesii TaxID=303347 RepID=A0AAN6S4A5_9PEZI|nr:hypothetical protein QBC46DRAFT_388157 [Diplogelasinospora grovesii]
MKGKIVDLEDKLNQRVTRIKDLEEQRKKGSRLEFKLREDIAELKEDLLHSKNELKAALDQANKDRRNLLQSHQRDDMVIRDLKRVLRSTTEAKKQLEGEVKESASLTTQLKAQLEDAKTQISELKQLAAKGSEDAIVQAPCQAPAAPRHLFRGATPAQTPTTTAPAVAAAAAAAADGDDIRVLWPTTRRLFGEAWDSAIHIRREFVEEWNRMNPGERYVTLTLFMVWLCAVMVLIYKNLMKWAQNSFETYVAEVVGQVLSARVVRAGLMDNWDERMIQRM